MATAQFDFFSLKDGLKTCQNMGLSRKAQLYVNIDI